MGILLVISVFLEEKNGWPTSVCFSKKNITGGSCVDFLGAWFFIGKNGFVTWISKHLQ